MVASSVTLTAVPFTVRSIPGSATDTAQFALVARLRLFCRLGPLVNQIRSFTHFAPIPAM
jgi:hypothetical protein